MDSRSARARWPSSGRGGRGPSFRQDAIDSLLWAVGCECAQGRGVALLLIVLLCPLAIPIIGAPVVLLVRLLIEIVARL